MAAELAGEGGVASGVAEGRDLAVQPGAPEMAVVVGALPDVGGERGVGLCVRPGLAGCPVAVEVDPDCLAVVSQLPGDLGHVRSVSGQGDGLPGVGLGDHPGMWSPAEAMSTGMASSVAFGDLLGAVEDGLDRGGADEAEQAADHAAAAGVQVRRQSRGSRRGGGAAGGCLPGRRSGRLHCWPRPNGPVRIMENRPAICSPRVPDSSPARSTLIPA